MSGQGLLHVEITFTEFAVHRLNSVDFRYKKSIFKFDDCILAQIFKKPKTYHKISVYRQESNFWNRTEFSGEKALLLAQMSQQGMLKKAIGIL